MSRITIRRGASALGASALIGLALAAPASAQIDPSNGGSDPVSKSTGVTAGDVRQHESAGSQDPSTAQLLQREKAYSYTMKPEAPKPAVKFITVDTNTIEYLQVGAGALAGMAVVGAGALVLSQTHRRRAAAV